MFKRIFNKELNDLKLSNYKFKTYNFPEKKNDKFVLINNKLPYVSFFTNYGEINIYFGLSYPFKPPNITLKYYWKLKNKKIYKIINNYLFKKYPKEIYNIILNLLNKEDSENDLKLVLCDKINSNTSKLSIWLKKYLNILIHDWSPSQNILNILKIIESINTVCLLNDSQKIKFLLK